MLERWSYGVDFTANIGERTPHYNEQGAATLEDYSGTVVGRLCTGGHPIEPS